MFQQAKPQEDQSNKVEGAQAVEFLKKSGLEPQMLKQIWGVAAKTNLSFLERDEFYIALRLIAYCQNGIPPTEESIHMNTPTKLPFFQTSFGTT